MTKQIYGSIDICTHRKYTPNELIRIFTEQKMLGTYDIVFNAGSYGLEIETYRPETAEEEEARIAKELEIEKKRLAFQKKRDASRKKELIAEAEKLGIKVIDG